jgi:hypothetical protein
MVECLSSLLPTASTKVLTMCGARPRRVSNLVCNAGRWLVTFICTCCGKRNKLRNKLRNKRCCPGSFIATKKIYYILAGQHDYTLSSLPRMYRTSGLTRCFNESGPYDTRVVCCRQTPCEVEMIFIVFLILRELETLGKVFGGESRFSDHDWQAKSHSKV